MLDESTRAYKDTRQTSIKRVNMRC